MRGIRSALAVVAGASAVALCHGFAVPPAAGRGWSSVASPPGRQGTILMAQPGTELTIAGFSLLAFQGIAPYAAVADYMILKDIFAYRSLPAVKEGELATLPGQPYLLYPEPVRLLDIINIMGRFSSFDEAAGTFNEKIGKPPAYLPREDFPDRIRSLKFQKWPLGPDGLKVGEKALGAAAIKSLERAMQKREIPDYAIEVVLDAFGTSPAASKQKVEEELSSWRSSPELFDVQKFERSLITTKISQLLTYGSILLLQFATVMSLIVQPISEYHERNGHWPFNLFE